jgi:CheY-like chemotaxis protein
MKIQKWILLAEDNPLDADLAKRALAINQVREEIVHAHDGVEAMDCLNRRGEFQHCPMEIPTVVLLDLKMPRVNGLEVLRRIKNDERFKNIPVVVFTSSKEEADVAQSYELGANAYVVKPVDFKEFRDTVKEVRAFWMEVNEPPPISPKLASA